MTVLLDDSLFSGPSLSPAWSPDDVAAGEVAPLFPLALNSARFDPAVTTGPRPRDAAMTAAEAFADRLSAAGAAAGLTVAPGVARLPAGRKPAADAGGQAGKLLAEVQSATVSQQVDLLLRTSDNYLTEVIGRMVAVASGKPASNDGAVAAVLQQLEELKIPVGHAPGRRPGRADPGQQGLGPAALRRGPRHDHRQRTPACAPPWPGSRWPG